MSDVCVWGHRGDPDDEGDDDEGDEGDEGDDDEGECRGKVSTYRHVSIYHVVMCTITHVVMCTITHVVMCVTTHVVMCAITHVVMCTITHVLMCVTTRVVMCVTTHVLMCVTTIRCSSALSHIFCCPMDLQCPIKAVINQSITYLVIYIISHYSCSHTGMCVFVGWVHHGDPLHPYHPVGHRGPACALV